MKKKFRIRRIRFYSATVTSIQKSPQITHRTHGIHHSPHTHTIPIPMGIPMGIPIPTAALSFFVHYVLSKYPVSTCVIVDSLFVCLITILCCLQNLSLFDPGPKIACFRAQNVH